MLSTWKFCIKHLKFGLWLNHFAKNNDIQRLHALQIGLRAMVGLVFPLLKIWRKNSKNYLHFSFFEKDFSWKTSCLFLHRIYLINWLTKSRFWYALISVDSDLQKGAWAKGPIKLKELWKEINITRSRRRRYQNDKQRHQGCHWAINLIYLRFSKFEV